MLNTVNLQGRLAADPELRHTSSGTSVASFRLAVARDFKNQDGKYDVDFINCVAWKGTAELVSKYFSKGDLAVVSGRLQTRKYTDKNGNNRTATEVIVSNVYFCSQKRAGSQADSGQGFEDLSDYDGELPF